MEKRFLCIVYRLVRSPTKAERLREAFEWSLEPPHGSRYETEHSMRINALLYNRAVGFGIHRSSNKILLCEYIFAGPQGTAGEKGERGPQGPQGTVTEHSHLRFASWILRNEYRIYNWQWFFLIGRTSRRERTTRQTRQTGMYCMQFSQHRITLFSIDEQSENIFIRK